MTAVGAVLRRPGPLRPGGARRLAGPVLRALACLATTLAAAPAAAQARVPPSVQPGVFRAPAFSIPRPAGDGWISRAQAGPAATFARPPVPGSASLAATVAAQKLDAPARSAEELAQLLKRRLGELGDRFVRLSESVEPEEASGRVCARYTQRVRDEGAVRPAGEPAPVMELHGLACLHPAMPGAAVDASYSARGPDGTLPADLAEQARRFFQGLVLHAPVATADEWRAFAEAGDADAQVWLAIQLKESDPERAAWLRKAADAGHAEGRTRLAIAYVRGEGGLRPNAGEALRLLGAAAEQGYARAAGLLGTFLLADESTAAQGLQWIERSARDGDALGELQLGLMTIAGQRGIERNPAAGAAWVGRAAAQGMTAAQLRYGDLYLVGLGVPRDEQRARFWFELAAAQGDPGAKKALEAFRGR